MATATRQIGPIPIIEYIKEVLGLVPLDIPQKFAPREIDTEAFQKRTEFRLSINTSKFGRVEVLFAFLLDEKKFLFIGISPNLAQQVPNINAVFAKPGMRSMYDECWDKPTTAGVVGCVVDKFTEWLFS